MESQGGTEEEGGCRIWLSETTWQGIGDCIDKYEPAWQKNDESDYYQKKLDDALAEAYGDELHDSFHKRYEYAPEFDYGKGRWK